MYLSTFPVAFMKSLCFLLGCSGINSECPGNPKCEILRRFLVCDPHICKECRDCNTVHTADCPGCLKKSARMKCNCREAFPDYINEFTEALLDFRYDGLPRNPEDLKINEKRGGDEHGDR